MNSKNIVLIVVWAQSILAGILILGLVLSLFIKTYADPSILAATVALSGALCGNLGSLLGGPHRMQSQTEISNTPDNPVPVTTEKPNEST